jgi:hypothetical protein
MRQLGTCVRRVRADVKQNPAVVRAPKHNGRTGAGAEGRVRSLPVGIDPTTSGGRLRSLWRKWGCLERGEANYLRLALLHQRAEYHRHSRQAAIGGAHAPAGARRG